MNASDTLRSFVTAALPDWRVQFGRWVDGNKESRYAVIRPMGGPPIDLVRRPQYSLMLIAAKSDDAQAADTAAQAVIAVIQADETDPIFMQPGEPVFWNTDDGRPIAELTISTITD